MWVISAPFDGELGDTGFQKRKLLKPNSSYMLGRKERPLLVNNKRVSQDHCQFVVGDHTLDDASSPSMRPSLKVINCMKKGKGVPVTRSGVTTHLEPTESMELEPGDRVGIISQVDVTIEWKSICAYNPITRGNGSIPIASCASLGIKLVYTPHPETTHHIASHYVANLSTATSLLTLTRFVKPEWLQEVLRLGNLPRDNEDTNGTPLEDHFVLPLENKFRPSFSPSLLPSQKQFDIWEPNEERVNLFNLCRFICLQEKVRDSDSDVKEAIHRGDGTLETFDIHAGVTKFNRAITRSQAKEGKRTVVIGDADSMQLAVGKETWSKFVAEARTFALEILPPSKIIQAVLETKLALLFPTASADENENDNQSRNSSPLPEMAANTIASEPSMPPIGSDAPSIAPPGPSRKLVRRAVSRAPSTEPSIPPTLQSTTTIDQSLLRPRQGLTRRFAGPTPIVTGLDDPSVVLDTPPELPPPTVRTVYDPKVPPTPARSSKLKRRVVEGGLILDSDAPQSGVAETVGEPPLKKFKALFESTNATGTGAESFEVANSVPGESMSQTQTQSDSAQTRPPRSRGLSSLAILREEEEEATQSGVGKVARQHRQKRRIDSVEEDVEMPTPDDADMLSDAAAPAAKKRAVEHVNSVERDANPPAPTAAAGVKLPPEIITTKHTQGAPTGKPDTDTAFLKAIASNKRGKKTEDEFDREFNNLKISKPELDTPHEPEKEWAVLADFGDDSGLRGNFMTIVELDLYCKDAAGQRQNQQRNTNPLWNGKPNFKKFKKKVVGSRPKVDVYLNEENNYGMGATYWKGGNSQAPNQTQASLFGSQMQSQINIAPQRQPSQKAASRPLLDSDEDEAPPARRSRKPPSRVGSAAPGKKPLAKSKRAPAKAAAALFLDSDDDIQEIKDEDHEDEATRAVMEEDETMTLQSSAEKRAPVSRPPTTRTTRATAKSKKPTPIIVDDDSDEGAVFKGFKGRK